MPQVNERSGFIGTHIIANRVAELGADITNHYAPLKGELLVIGILKGGFMFMADLVRCIQRPLIVDFMVVASYGTGTKSSGQVKCIYTPNTIREKHHVLVVDDILDSGATLNQVCNVLREQGPMRSLQTCVLLNKMTTAGRLFAAPYPRFLGFNLPHPGFVVGYGLDRAEHMRHLPYITRISE